MALPEKLLHEMVIEERLARIRMQNAVQALINFGLPLALEDLQSLNDEQRARKIQFLGLPESLVATLDPRTTTANLLPLFAPFDGVVIGREITVGETVSPDQSHFVIADIRRMWVIMDVRKEDANLVRIGQAITFVADELPTRIAGHIDWISTEVDASTRTLQVRAEVDNPVLDSAAGNHSEQRLLRARTYGTARIVVRSNPQAVVVPNSSVQREGDSFFVFSRRGNQFRRIGAQPGVVAGGWTEIREGIDAGVVVAAVGSHVVKAEMQLTRNDG